MDIYRVSIFHIFHDNFYHFFLHIWYALFFCENLSYFFLVCLGWNSLLIVSFSIHGFAIAILGGFMVKSYVLYETYEVTPLHCLSWTLVKKHTCLENNPQIQVLLSFLPSVHSPLQPVSGCYLARGRHHPSDQITRTSIILIPFLIWDIMQWNTKIRPTPTLSLCIPY